MALGILGTSLQSPRCRSTTERVFKINAMKIPKYVTKYEMIFGYFLLRCLLRRHLISHWTII